MAGPREDIEQALGRAVEVAGPDIVRQPHRLRAILADFVGSPGSDHRDEIGLIVDVVRTAIESGTVDDLHITTEVERRHSSDAVRWAVRTLGRHGLPIERAPDPGRTPLWRASWVLASLVLAVIAVPVMVLLVPDPDPGDTTVDDTSDNAAADDDDSSDVTTSESTADPPPPEPSEIVGYRVDFDQSVEGAYTAQRTWEIRDGQVAGTIVLTPASNSGLAQHRELVPGDSFSNPVFTPEPTSTSGDVASYSLDLAAGPVTITFVADLTTTEPDQDTVQSWVDGWRERVPSLRPVDADPAATATVTALS